MAVNKVEYYGETLIDLTDDTISPENVVEGATFHNSRGEKSTGVLRVTDANPDWNQNDETAPDYIANRTHWVETSSSVNVIFEDAMVEWQPFLADFGEIGTSEVEPVLGRTYNVTCDGEVYECVAWYVEDEYDELGCAYIGNGSYYWLDGYGEDVPFLIKVDRLNYDISSYSWTARNSADIVGIATFNIAISEVAVDETITQLDEKYIPDSIARVKDIPEGFSGSWNDLTDKPFGEEAVLETVVEETRNWGYTETEWTNGDGMPSEKIKSGDKCIVTVDGVKYPCVAYDFLDGQAWTCVCLGDSRLYDNYDFEGNPITDESHPEDVPFNVAYGLSDDGASGILWNHEFYFGYTDDDTHAIKIEKVVGEITKTLDEKYIPDSIARVEDIPTDYLTSIPEEYVTDTELNAKGYLTSIPEEYITDSELAAKGYLTQHQSLSGYAKESYVQEYAQPKGSYLTSIPSEYVTDSELNAKGYLTSIPEEYITDSELTAKGYLTQHQDLSAYAKTADMQTQLNKKANDFSLEIYNGTGGNPKPVKFMSVNYSTCGSENGVAIKVGMVSGHGNGSSYACLQDAIIKVTHTGVVTVDNFKYYGASTGTYDGASRQYGDIFWVIDTTNKIVDFYCLMGQYARIQMTPYKRVTYSTGGTITQHTSCTVYSSGEKVWGNNSEFALLSDVPSKTETWTFTLEDGSTVNKVVYVG